MFWGARKPNAVVAALSVLLWACNDKPIERSPDILASYVVLGEDVRGKPQVNARVIVPGYRDDCPYLVGEGEDQRAMTFRDNPHGFSVRVCEALVPFDQQFVISWDDRALPVAKMNPEHFLLIGDTGCDAYTCPEGVLATPFEQLAQAASEVIPRPHVIIHVGDFNYRGTPKFIDEDQSLRIYDAGDYVDGPGCSLYRPYVSQNAGYSQIPDSWENWRVDFFGPAESLLQTAPFVAARGNHELCSRAGPGWLYFLDSNSNLDGGRQRSCPPQGESAPPSGGALPHVLFLPPRSIDLGTLYMVVLDSANACDDFAPATTEIYRDQLEETLSVLPDDQPTWLVSHRPFWGVFELCTANDDSCEPEVITRSLQVALARAMEELGGLPEGLRLFVSGHMHLFQSLVFDAPQAQDQMNIPPQLVVGNGGVQLATGPGPGDFGLVDGSVVARGFTSEEYGFVTIPSLAADGSWQGEMRGLGSIIIAHCQQPPGEGALCAPAVRTD